jgi:cytochrome c peroxidase
VWGSAACTDAEKSYEFIGLAIAAYEGSAELNQFSSKYDAVLAGAAELTAEERRGFDVFAGKGRCTSCHPHTRGQNGEPPLFTDFRFDNIGVPRNPTNPFYGNREANPAGDAWIDEGLGGFLATQPAYTRHAQTNMGKHRAPTLRNVDVRPSSGFIKAYGHNGYFKSLEQVVHFYNTRDVLPACTGTKQRPGVDCWPRPEVASNLNTEELGKLGLTDDEERVIVAFLKTLSDGYTALGPR